MQNNEGRVRELIAEQAADAGLWFHAETAAEAYVQAALRRLHAVIEGDEIMAVVSEPAPSSEEGGEPTAGIDLAWAAQQLVDRMKMCHEDAAYKSVWMVNQLHVGSYKGPTYTYELRQLEQALKDRPEMAGGEGNTDGNGVRPDHKSEGGNHSVPVQVDLLRPSPQSSPPPDAKVGEHPLTVEWRADRKAGRTDVGLLTEIGDRMAVALHEQAQKIVCVTDAHGEAHAEAIMFRTQRDNVTTDLLLMTARASKAEAALTLSSQRSAELEHMAANYKASALAAGTREAEAVLRNTSLEKVVEAAREYRLGNATFVTDLYAALDALPQARAEQKP